MVALLLQPGKQRNRHGLSGFHRGNVNLINRIGSLVHIQIYRHILPLVLSAVSHLHLNAQRMLHRRQPRRYIQLGNRHVARHGIFAHPQHVHINIALIILDQLLDVRVLLPPRGLAVGHDVNFLPQIRAFFEDIDCRFHCRKQIRGMMADLRPIQLRMGLIQIVGRLVNDASHNIRSQQHADGRARWQGIHRGLGGLTSLLKGGASAAIAAFPGLQAKIHAVGIIQNHDAGDLGLTQDVGGGILQSRPSQRQRQQGHQRATDQQQDQIFDAHAALVLVDAQLHKLHRRPRHRLEFPPVEQVNDDRHCHCR